MPLAAYGKNCTSLVQKWAPATYKNIKVDDASRYLPSDEQIRQQVEMAEREFIEGLNDSSLWSEGGL